MKSHPNVTYLQTHFSHPLSIANQLLAVFIVKHLALPSVFDIEAIPFGLT